MSDSNIYSVGEAAALMVSGKLTATRLAEDCLARLGEREKDTEAWAYIDPERVLAQARACDREPKMIGDRPRFSAQTKSSWFYDCWAR